MKNYEYILLFVTVFLAGSVGFFLQKNTKIWLQIFLSFSGAYIFGITMMHLLPEVFEILSNKAGYWILLGFFLQLLLEQVSKGVEHGHFHLPHQANRVFALQIMFGLCVHAFFEGIPLSQQQDNRFFYSIILHHAPAALALVILFISSKYSKNMIIFCLLLFALMPPLGAALGAYLQMPPQVENIILAVVVGSFLHIATTILFEIDNSEANHHHLSWKRMLSILIGILAAIGL